MNEIPELLVLHGRPMVLVDPFDQAFQQFLENPKSYVNLKVYHWKKTFASKTLPGYQRVLK